MTEVEIVKEREKFRLFRSDMPLTKIGNLGTGYTVIVMQNR